MIPNSRISPAAAKILAALPAPAPTLTVLNNFVGSGSGPFNQNSFDTRIDYAASQTMNVFGRFSLDYFKLSGTGCWARWGALAMAWLGLGWQFHHPQLQPLNRCHQDVQRSLLDGFPLRLFQIQSADQKPDGGAPMTAFGIPGANTSDPKTAGLGAFLLGSDPISGQGCTHEQWQPGCVISSFGDGLGVARCNCPLTESEQQFQFVNNWTKIKGNHIFKFGADIRYAENLRIPSDNNRTGEYNFSPEANLEGGSGGWAGSGHVPAGRRYLLCSIRQQPQPASANNAAERQKRCFFYGQDTWRATSKLTLNLGLRWEIYFPEYGECQRQRWLCQHHRLTAVLAAIRVAGYGPYGSERQCRQRLQRVCPALGSRLPGQSQDRSPRGLWPQLRHRRVRFQLRTHSHPEPARVAEAELSMPVPSLQALPGALFRSSLWTTGRSRRYSLQFRRTADSFLLTKSGYRIFPPNSLGGRRSRARTFVPPADIAGRGRI